MQSHLTLRFHVTCRDVRIGITEQQEKLKKNQTGRPYGGGTAEPWQDLLRNHGLNEEQQKGACEDRCGVDEHRRTVGRCGRVGGADSGRRGGWQAVGAIFKRAARRPARAP